MRTRTLAVFLALCGACAGDLRPRIIAAANVAEPTLVAVYEAQGDACVTGSKARADAVSCVAALDASWAKVWTALAAVQSANDAAAAWCTLSSALAPLGSASLPAVDGVVCP